MKLHTMNSLRLGALLAAATLALTGCATTPASDTLTMTDAWVKAADSGMTAAFGELRNDTGTDVVITGVQSAASDALELHETIEDDAGQMIMRKVDAGFAVPSGGTLTLEPGGDHIMLMGLTAPLRAGEDVTFTLTMSDGSVFEFTAPVKDYSGANENYRDEHADH